MLEHRMVAFDIYCPKCEHWNENECLDPCDLCLSDPFQIDSRKPLYFKEQEATSKVSKKKMKQ